MVSFSPPGVRLHMRFACTFAVFWGFATSLLAGEMRVYHAAQIWPGNGPPLADAVLVVQEGKIVAVGKASEVTIPEKAVRHNLGKAVIIPGLIAGETGLAEGGRDDAVAFTPQHRAVDGFDWYGDYAAALAGGVTTVQVSPGSRRLVPGQGAVVKLHGADLDRRTLKAPESLRIVLGEAYKNPPRIYEPPVGAVSVERPLLPTQPQLAGSLATAVAGLRGAFVAAKSPRPRLDPILDALALPMNEKLRVRVSASGAGDVSAVLALAKEFDLRLTLVEPNLSGTRVGDWKPYVEGVVLNAGVRPGAIGDGLPPRPPADLARQLLAAAFPVALKPVQDADLKDLLYLAGQFRPHLSEVEALRLVTADAAAVLGVGDRVGTLAEGKDADFVVLSGPPFAVQTRVRQVYVDGEPVVSAGESKRRLLRAGRIFTGTGEALSDAAVLIDHGKIQAVGREVALPPDVVVQEFPDAVIVPGFIDLGVTFGVGGSLSSAVPLQTRLGERLVIGDPAYKPVRQAGVTTVLFSGPAPAAVVAYKPTDKPRVVQDPVALRFALRGNLSSASASLRETLRAGKAYADAWDRYEKELPLYEQKKKEYDAQIAAQQQARQASGDQEQKAGEQKAEEKADEKKPEPPRPPERPQANPALEPYRALFARRIPALVEVQREDAIRLAIAICREEFDLKLVLVGAEDAPRVGKLLAEKDVGVILGPQLVRASERDPINVPMELALSGVAFGFQSQAGLGSRLLPGAVGYAVHRGLAPQDGLHGLTARAAQLVGLNQVGTLTAGKDADLVVLSGSPFDPATRVLAVMIDGEWVHE